MTGIYGAKERADLASLAAQINAAASSGVLGQAIADKLRTSLPDIDDLTIGRVLVALTIDAAGVFEAATSQPGSNLTVTLWLGLAAAGLAMTEEEWR